MKKIAALFFVIFSLHSVAQEKIPTTDQFTIEGLVKNKLIVTIPSLASYQSHSTDSIVITNHLLQKKYTMKNVKGVLLKEILTKAEIPTDSPKLLSEFYIICIASDNYKVIFSWNEIFNTQTGGYVFVITEHDGKPTAQTDDRIALISTHDIATGRRFVKGLKEIRVERVK